jgi:hypothetical protein
MGPAFCENPFAFEVSFRVYLNEIAWFVVARDEVRRAPSQIAIEAFVMT